MRCIFLTWETAFSISRQTESASGISMRRRIGILRAGRRHGESAGGGIGRKSALHSGCERWKALYYGIPESLRTLGGFRRRFFRTEESEGKEKQNHPAGAVEAIDILSLYIKTAEEYFSEKEIQDAITAFCSSGIVNVEDATYYDPAAKMFFHVYTDGNYYHGYEVRYPRLSPKEVIQSHIRVHFSPQPVL